MLWTRCVGSDERQIDVGLRNATEFLFGLLACFLQSLEGHRFLSQIDAIVLLELGRDVVDQSLVEVVTAEVRITAGADHFEDFAATSIFAGKSHFQDRYVKRTTTQVKHDDLVILRLVQTIGQGCGSRLVDDTSYLESSDLTCVLGSLSLRIVKVCRNRITALLTRCPRYDSAASLSFLKTLADTSCGVYCWCRSES